MNINRNVFRRPMAIVSAAALTLGVAAPALVGSVANAGQVSTRSIQLSDSTPSATGVSYKVTFTPTSVSTIGAIVVDFCSDSPIIGNTTCAYPANFSVGGATPTTSGAPTGFSTSTGSWVTTSSQQGGAAASARQVFEYTNSTAQTPSGSAISFTITNAVNPSANGSFYARILTFDTAADAATYTASGTTRAATTSLTGMRDYGGIALSTASNIAISATVQETLAFCTSGLVGGVAPSTCGSTATPAVTLGTGTPPTIDSSSVYDNSTGAYQTFMILSTNATNGASVAMKSNYASCNGLSRDNGLTCGIPGQTTGLTQGVAGFGMKVGTGTGGTGTIKPATTNNYSATTFHMGSTDTTSSPYGDVIANTNGTVCANVVSQLTFGATANLTSPAGVYATNETLIATGTF